jgi:CHAD domain-containing protein
MMETIAQSYTVDLTLSATQQTNSSFVASMASQATSVTDGTLSALKAEDMHSFKQALESKAEEFRARLREHRITTQNEEDEFEKRLNELRRKVEGLDNGE